MFDFVLKIFAWKCEKKGWRAVWCWASKIMAWLLLLASVALGFYKLDVTSLMTDLSGISG